MIGIKQVLINRMFKMSAFSFHASCEMFAKAQNRFVDCFIRQIGLNKSWFY